VTPFHCGPAGRKAKKVPGQQSFSLADLRAVADELYATPHWRAALARDLKVTTRTVEGWFDGKPLPDLRRQLADLCRRCGADDSSMERLARKLQGLGPPESCK
jgi:hypothetical protein